jgi:alginate O-acetyltransferase complex protein AlgI
VLFFEYGFLFVFLPVVLLVHAAVPRRLRNGWLLLASLLFYATSSFEFLPILLLSICVDYFAGLKIDASERPGVRRAWLVASLCTNLGLLGYFKYAGFFSSALRAALGPGIPLLSVALPVGISFYTFESMSYTIDVYRRVMRPFRSPVDYACIVALFPRLIAGPIVRFSAIAGQVAGRAHDDARFAGGIVLFTVGLVKKLLVADTLALAADPIFAAGAPGFLDAWGSAILFAGQIYFDFSGYSDMAIGLGRLLGFEFPPNFMAPYRAQSFADFWRRWHISLSSWLRDYLYVPLGGNRRGTVRTYVNLIATMLLGGLWHGASWNFVLWGGGHGALLAAERALGERNPLRRLPARLQVAAVFLAVTALWVPFRVESLAQVGSWFGAMFAGAGGLGSLAPTAVLALALFLVLVAFPKPVSQWQLLPRPAHLAWVGLLFVGALFVGYGRLTSSPFLYFRF